MDSRQAIKYNKHNFKGRMFSYLVSATSVIVSDCSCTAFIALLAAGDKIGSMTELDCFSNKRTSMPLLSVKHEHTQSATVHTRISRSLSTAGYLSFGPTAQCAVHALKGLACRAHVMNPGQLACLALQAVLSAHVAFAHVAFAPRVRLRQSFLRTLRSQKA